MNENIEAYFPSNHELEIFLSRHGHMTQILKGARGFYQARGRGVLIFNEWTASRSKVFYMDVENMAEFPNQDGEVSRLVKGLVDGYDPKTQAVCMFFTAPDGELTLKVLPADFLN